MHRCHLLHCKRGKPNPVPREPAQAAVRRGSAVHRDLPAEAVHKDSAVHRDLPAEAVHKDQVVADCACAAEQLPVLSGYAIYANQRAGVLCTGTQCHAFEDGNYPHGDDDRRFAGICVRV